MIKNINSTLAGQLLARVGDEDALFSMSRSELSALGRLPGYLTDPAYRQQLLQRAQAEERFIMSNDIETLYFRGPCYPSRLSNCEDGPVMLYQIGQTNLEARHIVSIVGTRHATPHGIDITSRIVHELAERLDDLVIVSGLAYGIDVAAHKAALECGIPTVAIAAHPLNTIYPADHRGVAVKIIRQGGALVSEYSTSHEVHRANFLARNRIIAGISDVTIVVESDAKGGSLVTARMAMDYDREVFAVPGRLTDKYSRGTLNLISTDRAHIYVSADDFIDEMGWESRPVEGDQGTLKLELNPVETQILSYLTSNPASRVNDIMIGTGIPNGQLKDALFTMEMKDLIMSMPGGKYSAL